MNIKKIEDKARLLMRGRIDPKRLSILYYYILEDANYHTPNSQLTGRGVFGRYRTNRNEIRNTTYFTPESYGTPYAEKLWEEYRKKGGKTWEL